MSDHAPCWLIPDHLITIERDHAALERRAANATAALETTSGPGYYPPANRTAQWFGNVFPGSDMGGIDKIVWHTTETGGWPSYSGGASAPTLTYDPRRHEWRQHFLLYRSARALRDPDYTLVRENRDKVCQVELVAFSDHGMADRYGGLDIRDLDDRALQDLGAFARFMHDEYGVPYTAAPLLDYPASYGNSRVRMTGPQFDAFKGHCGHENVSGNSHGDPDSMPLNKVLAYAQGDDDMPLTDADKKFIADVVINRIDDIAKAVWGHRLPNRGTVDNPDDTLPAGDILGYAHKAAVEARANTTPTTPQPPPA